MPRLVRHRDDDTKILFDFPSLEAMQDCDDRVICLSERSMEMIIQCLNSIQDIRTRVYSSYLGHQEYLTVDDTEFDQFQMWVSDIRTQLGGYMACNEYLERIAIAAEAMLQSQDEQTVDLFDVLEAMGIDPTEEEADLLEALQYILGLPHFSGLPSFKVPIGTWISGFFEGRYKSAHLQLLRDISISQRGQAVAQGGADFASLYDTMGETADSMLVKAGYLGKAYWLWRWIDNDQLPGWLGWLTTISGLVLGSIRGATYDVVEALEELLGIKEAINNQTLTAIVNCNNCTMSDLAEHLHPDGQPAYVTVEGDSSWSNAEEPPTSDDTEWNEPPTETDYKCQAAKYIVDWLQAFYGHSEWNLSPDDNLITLADKFAAILASIPAIGPGLSGLSSIIGLTLAYLSSGQTDIFVTVNEKITDRRDDLICALYNASNAQNARDEFEAIMIEEDLNILAMNGLMVFLTMNNIMAILFYEPEVIAEEIAFKDDDCPCGEDLGEYTVNYGIETSENPSNPIVIEMVFEAGYACGSEARNAGINFVEARIITGITIDGVGVGECFSAPLFGYGTDEGDQAGIDAPDASDSSFPTPEDPTVPVYSMYVLCAVTSGNPILTVTYATP